MELEPYGPLARGLCRYLREVGDALGVGFEATCWDLDERASAYVALDGRLPGYPDHDLALIWDEENGWAAALEGGRGDDMIVLCYLGYDVLAPSAVVAGFVDALRADGYPGQPDPPALRAAFCDDGFAERLATFPLPAVAGLAGQR
ncbi:MAG: DUF6292 family protein [Labedaea sp.]